MAEQMLGKLLFMITMPFFKARRSHPVLLLKREPLFVSEGRESLFALHYKSNWHPAMRKSMEGRK